LLACPDPWERTLAADWETQICLVRRLLFGCRIQMAALATGMFRLFCYKLTNLAQTKKQ